MVTELFFNGRKYPPLRRIFPFQFHFTFSGIRKLMHFPWTIVDSSVNKLQSTQDVQNCTHTHGRSKDTESGSKFVYSVLCSRPTGRWSYDSHHTKSRGNRARWAWNLIFALSDKQLLIDRDQMTLHNGEYTVCIRCYCIQSEYHADMFNASMQLAKTVLSVEMMMSWPFGKQKATFLTVDFS